MIKINWAVWWSNLGWALFLGFPLGIVGNLVSGLVSEKQPSISVSCRDPSFVGGVSIIDLLIYNDGSYDLDGLDVSVTFEKTVQASLEPIEWARYLQANGREFLLKVPREVKFQQGAYVALRFSSQGLNQIENFGHLPNNIQAKLTIDKVVSARWRTPSLPERLLSPGVLVAVLIMVVLVLIAMLFVVARKLSQATQKEGRG